MVGSSQLQSRGVDVGILAPRSPVSPPGPLFSVRGFFVQVTELCPQVQHSISSSHLVL